VDAVTALVARVRSLAGAADRGLLALRDEMTPGQRWTAALAMGLAVLVLAYGVPHPLVVSGVAASERGSAPASSGATAGATAAPSPAGAAPAPASAAPDASLPAVGGPEEPTGEPQASAAAGPLSPPSFVAVVRAGDNPVPGRDDASIAKAFLAHAGFLSTVAPIAGTDPGFCMSVVAGGNVVLAGAGVDPALRSCLVAAGETVVAFDGAGDQPPAGGGGQVVSTRRGLADSLVDLGRWAASSGALGGRVGLVIDDAARDTAGPVVAAFQALGINVVATASVADDPTSSSVTDGVRAFAAKGVEVAVLAAPVAVQDRWVAQAAVLVPGLRYVVADGFDAIGNESYPATFDGALAHTSLRVPWFARAHRQTPEQTACLQAWQATVTPAQTLSSAETLDVFAWCEEVKVIAAALETPGPFGGALRSVRLASPATSDLGPLPPTGWGPTQDAVLAWHSSCACWQEKSPFADRRSS
jgi:hypothetical protein